VNRLPTTAYAKESLLREARSIALLGVSQAIPMSNTCSNRSAEVRKRERPEQGATGELRLPEEWPTFPRMTALNKVAGLDRSKAVATPGRPRRRRASWAWSSTSRHWFSILAGGLDVPSLYWGGAYFDIIPASVAAAYEAAADRAGTWEFADGHRGE
jgi:hypothetical protein